MVLTSSAMRYLYGDSAPFPLNYDFLATLEAFLGAATRIVRLEFASRDAAVGVEEAKRLREVGQGEVDRFHDIVVMAIRAATDEMRHPNALEFSRQLAQYASRYADETRQRMGIANEQDGARIQGEAQGRVVEQRAALSQFLKVVRLPVLTTSMSAVLVANGREAHYEVNAQFDHPDGIFSAFALRAESVPSWHLPRKVGELAEHTELTVGIDKSWLRGTVTPKQIPVDDWILSEFAFSDDVFEVTLKKRLTDPEALAFRIERGDGGLTGTVSSNGESATALDGTLAAHDLAALERIWRGLVLACKELEEHKGELLEVSLDGQAVFEHGLVLPFVARLITTFAPTVHEIALRSPSAAELSLKHETEAGRREEIYLRKSDLLRTLEPLSAEGRRIFAPLGLDSWVPSMTAEPPAVSKRVPPPEPAPQSQPTAEIPVTRAPLPTPIAAEAAPPGAFPDPAVDEPET